MLRRIAGYLGSVFSAACLAAGCAETADCLTLYDVPCTVKVAGIVVDGTSKSPLSSIEVRLELYGTGASSAHSSVSQRTDEKGRFELKIVYENLEDRCFVTVPAGSHPGILYQGYAVEVQLLKDSAGYDAGNSTFTVENLPIFLTRE